MGRVLFGVKESIRSAFSARLAPPPHSEWPQKHVLPSIATVCFRAVPIFCELDRPSPSNSDSGCHRTSDHS